MSIEVTAESTLADARRLWATSPVFHALVHLWAHADGERGVNVEYAIVMLRFLRGLEGVGLGITDHPDKPSLWEADPMAVTNIR